jgi:hypothetical protein
MRKSRKSLEEKGWMFQFVADETLAKDAVEIYNLLDYEVHLQPLKRTHSRKASSPYLEGSQGQCRIVYIRPKKITG